LTKDLCVRTQKYMKQKRMRENKKSVYKKQVSTRKCIKKEKNE
jgi:hypothetical protein